MSGAHLALGDDVCALYTWEYDVTSRVWYQCAICLRMWCFPYEITRKIVQLIARFLREPSGFGGCTRSVMTKGRMSILWRRCFWNCIGKIRSSTRRKCAYHPGPFFMLDPGPHVWVGSLLLILPSVSFCSSIRPCLPWSLRSGYRYVFWAPYKMSPSQIDSIVANRKWRTKKFLQWKTIKMEGFRLIWKKCMCVKAE